MTSESHYIDENFSFLQGESVVGAQATEGEVAGLDSTFNISNINDVSTQKRRGTVKVVPSRYMSGSSSRTRETGAPASSRETLASVKHLEKTHAASSSRTTKTERAGQSTSRTASSRLTINPVGSSSSSSSAAKTSRIKTSAVGASSSRTASGTSSTRRVGETTATSSSRITSSRAAPSGTHRSGTASKTIKDRSSATADSKPARSGTTSSSDASSDPKKQASRNAKLAQRLQVFNNEMEILYSYRLQWEFINARAEQASAKQRAEVERQLFAATQRVARLREEVCREQALLEKDKYTLHLEEIINTQFSIMPLLQASLDRISSEFAELSSAVEATTHRLPTTGIIVPTTEQLLQELSTSEQTLNDILAIADPHLDKLGEYAASMEGLTAVLGEELRELKQCKDLLTETSMLEAQRRSLLIHYMQEHGCRPDSHVSV